MVNKLTLSVVVALMTVAVVGCAQQVKQVGMTSANKQVDVEKLFIVDCLLPGQVRKLGGQMSYLTPRLPIKTSAIDCEIRGGEYVAYDRSDYRTALKVWLDGAKAGDPEAQTNVGEIYEKGLGTQSDYQSAYAWYKKAAEQNYSSAQINLGYMYEKGLGIEKDVAKALNWYRKASGLTDDDLEFSSTIEVTVASQVEQKTQKLREEIERRKQEAQLLRQQLDKTEKKLKLRKTALSTAENRVVRLNKQLKSLNTEGAKSKLKAVKQELVQEEAKIITQQKELDWLQTELKQQKTGLKKELESVKVQEHQLSENQDSELAGPVIEIIDPPVVVTRGVPSVKLRTFVKERLIVGKVTAPAGILAITVNDQPQKLAHNNVFKANIEIEKTDTAVSVVAVDKQGRRATVDFMFIPKFRNAPATVTKPLDKAQSRRVSSIDFGSYYALIIGNNRYPKMPDLATAVSDAERAEKVLRDQYGFKTSLLLNATRYDILSELNRLREQLTDQDNLLIYYAGHGEIDRINMQGYWLPVDAEPNSTANWISNISITEQLNAMKAKHVLVVADSCYSGSLTRSSLARLDIDLTDEVRQKWMGVMAKTRSRTVLTSGGIKPVMDSGGGSHSIFAQAFFDSLESNENIMEGYKVYRDVADKVHITAAKFNIEQTPQYAPIRHGGHESGEFLFVPVK
ncbi:MAG: caspase family protein [Gammaproteobacteria bacterium]|nr:caspase family protein [Gammaproteobacteria bacterium]